MNMKNTIVLAALIAVGAVGWFVVGMRQKPAGPGATVAFLEKELKPEAITSIEVTRGGERRFFLERRGDVWTLPGEWPVRKPEAQEIVRLLGSLDTRFVSVSVSDKADLKTYGLETPSLIVKLKVGDKSHTLSLGEGAEANNRFSRPTWLRLDEQPEVIRLGPGVVTALDRNQEFFQQRRLFAVERVAKDEDAKDKVEQVAASKVEIKSADGKGFTVAKQGDDWTITEPTTDRVDADKMRSLLVGLTDLWAERFVHASKKSMEEMGLKEPEYTITVVRDNVPTTLFVGKISETKERPIIKQPPPQQNPFAPPPKPQITIVKEEYRFAKLPKNEQIFEIRTDKFKDVAISMSDLRDPKVARFKTEDVRRIQIKHGKDELVLVKFGDKNEWKFEQPVTYAAETKPVEDLLDKLSGLRATDADVIDKADRKAVGLETPAATIKLTVDETKKKEGDAKEPEKKQRDLVFHLGENAKEKEKAYIEVVGWPRVNKVDGSLLSLARRPVLAYRNRKVLDVAAGSLQKIEVERASETFALAQKDGKWALSAPVAGEVEQSKAENLADDLARLEATEFVSGETKADELEKMYGLVKPALKAKLTFTDAKSPAKTLIVGKERPFKDDYYARFDDGPIFLVKKSVREALDKDSLSYRPLAPVKFESELVRAVMEKKDDAGFELRKTDKTWKLVAPFEAGVNAEAVNPLLDELERLKAEKIVAHNAKDAAKFGLEKPYLRIDVKTGESRKKGKDDDEIKEPAKEKEPAKGKETPKEKETATTILIGSLAEGGKGRYAKLGETQGVYVLSEKTVAALDRSALDLLEKDLLKLDAAKIRKVSSKGTPTYALQKAGGMNWQIVDSPAAAFTPDEEAAQAMLKAWSNLRADKYVAFGSKIDWTKYGLEKPGRVLQATSEDSKEEHTITLGGDAGDGKRYARIDKNEAVVALDAATSSILERTHLDYMDLRVLKYPFDAVASIERRMKDNDLELAKQDDGWRIMKPIPRAADASTADDIVEKTFQLRAVRIAEYPAKDLRAFGLQESVAEAAIVLNDGKKHVIKIGDLVDKEGKKDAGRRYAMADMNAAVFVLSAELSKHLTAPALYFADRNLPTFASADRADLSKGPRQLSFIKVDNAWKVAEPIRADAEESLDEFIRAAGRLRADEIVADKGADLKAFGLDRPTAEWKFFSGTRELQELLIGGPEKGKEKEQEPRRYARFAKGDQVFLLNAKTAAKALAEYRNRKPWTSLDAVQVDKLSYQSKDASFTFSKSDSTWKVQGMPEAKVDAKAVGDTLDALASLKASRFISDTKGDLQLHGLQPPLLTIEASTSNGKKTLYVGRNEGDSTRVYASAEGIEGIFVIAEEDARRIVRPLSAFLEKTESKSEKK
ncbi:MAG: DUF4340 domain-containing protein [Gemmataceae bacterium]|nr:DUF4340 domain-containing protein [Gemmataceae bacterium]